MMKHSCMQCGGIGTLHKKSFDADANEINDLIECAFCKGTGYVEIRISDAVFPNRGSRDILADNDRDGDPSTGPQVMQFRATSVNDITDGHCVIMAMSAADADRIALAIDFFRSYTPNGDRDFYVNTAKAIYEKVYSK